MEKQEISTRKLRKIVRFLMVTSQHARSGKDTLVDILYEHHKRLVHKNLENHLLNPKSYFIRERFAQPLIDSFKTVFGHDWDIEKTIPGMREKLIAFSTACQNIDHDVWINKTERDLKHRLSSIIERQDFDVINVFFTDTRYNYEYHRMINLFFDLKMLNGEFYLIEVKTDQVGKVTDRSFPEKSITVKPDIEVFNKKTSMGEYEEEIIKHLGFLFNA